MIEDYFKDLTYKSPTTAKDSGGMVTVTLSDAVSFRGYLYQQSGREQRRHERLAVVSTHGLLFEFGASLKSDCAVFDGTTEYKVLSVNENPGNRDHHKQADLELVH